MEGYTLSAPLPADVRSGRISHAYIVPDGVTAYALAAAAVCSGAGARPCGACRDCVKAQRGVHPDIITAGPDEPGKEIHVDKIRALRSDAVVMPNEAARKAYIVKNADMMNKSAQNALLKMLEEPAGGAVFILQTPDAAALLDTVQSRCVRLGFARQDSTRAPDADSLASLFIDALTGPRDELCGFTFRLDRLDKSGVMAFIDEAETLVVRRLRDIAVSGAQPEPYSRALTALSRAREYAKLNVSAGHISGLLLARLI